MVFQAVLRRYPGPGAWVFAPVPEDHAPEVRGPFGRVPVTATVDGTTWSTSVWRDSRAGWLLAVPARVRGGKDDGDVVSVEVVVDASRL
ncbi:DUF1905 domain-containing protein [Kocuria sediminis]|uniref:DUF1905 domain-containing protein n=1 Tax=Kocuria sediminis TaxID=1038857 RepID=A0A6N8GRZ5_9MICC|nr:DUF1905 domain-containing protein [Kocuria sediminis]MUN64957.1 DUF1905 domain-containing protein [Kocuria sediminis]